MADQKKFEGTGVMYQPSHHFSQIHTKNYMLLYGRKIGLFTKILS